MLFRSIFESRDSFYQNNGKGEAFEISGFDFFTGPLFQQLVCLRHHQPIRREQQKIPEPAMKIVYFGILALFSAFDAWAVPTSSALINAQKAIRQVSCAQSSKISEEPFVFCERVRTNFLDSIKALMKMSEQYEREFKTLSMETLPAVDIDEGAQCELGLLMERAVGNISALWVETNGYYRRARAVGALLEDAQHRSFRELHERTLKARREKRCFGSRQSTELECNPKKIILGISEVRQMGKVIRDTAEPLLPLSDEIEAIRSQAKKRQMEISQKYHCPKARQKVVDSVRKASRMVIRKDGYGSGVFVRAKDQDGTDKTWLLTASHVLTREKSFLASSGLMESGLISANTASANSEFSEAEERLSGALNEGGIHLANDSLHLPTSFHEEALPLVESGRRPEPGQEFQLTGFPMSENGEYSSRTCSFVGFGMGNRRIETAYYLDCPGAEFGSSSGNSGGALVDNNGVVWGVYTSNLLRKNGLLRVSPVSADASGKIVHGIQQGFVTDHCVNPFTEETRRCQILPGYTYEQVGP